MQCMYCRVMQKNERLTGVDVHTFETNIERLNNMRINGTDTWVQTYEMSYTREPNNPLGPHC